MMAVQVAVLRYHPLVHEVFLAARPNEVEHFQHVKRLDLSATFVV
jgi:hypothetical protein